MDTQLSGNCTRKNDATTLRSPTLRSQLQYWATPKLLNTIFYRFFLGPQCRRPQSRSTSSYIGTDLKGFKFDSFPIELYLQFKLNFFFQGVNCETDIDECLSGPCLNGMCVDGINEYICNCNDGYEVRYYSIKFHYIWKWTKLFEKTKYVTSFSSIFIL